jgi:hypothetical protein
MTASADPLRIAGGWASAQEALAFFEALPPVELDAMLGQWVGAGLPSGHPLDGALEAYGWHGKRFDTPEEVHPLVFRRGARTFHAAPAVLFRFVPLLLRLPWLMSPRVARVARLLLPLFATRRSAARLRMVRFAGGVSATLVYDTAPIQDVFRRVDADTVMGMMDLKGMAQPFFFLLRRERGRRRHSPLAFLAPQQGGQAAGFGRGQGAGAAQHGVRDERGGARGTFHGARNGRVRPVPGQQQSPHRGGIGGTQRLGARPGLRNGAPDAVDTGVQHARVARLRRELGEFLAAACDHLRVAPVRPHVRADGVAGNHRGAAGQAGPDVCKIVSRCSGRPGSRPAPRSAGA